MRTLALSLALTLCPLAAAAEPRFTPVTNMPDHIVTMTLKHGWSPDAIGTLTITHHAGWSRTDRVERNRKTTSYFGHASATDVTLYPGGPDEYTGLMILRGDEQERATYLDFTSFKTGERDTVLGESCEVWNVFRARERGPNPTRFMKLSCITADGIELWHRYVGNQGIVTSAEATMIERRAVAADDIQPPRHILDSTFWLRPNERPATAPPAARGDYEAEMEVTGGLIESAKFKQITRRHDPWLAIETVRADGVRELTVSNNPARLPLRFERHGDIFKTLLLYKVPANAPTGEAITPTDLGRKETVLGETCMWFDMMPKMADAGLTQCRTIDHVVLKEVRSSRGSQTTLQAVRLRRRAVSLAEVMPPPEIWVRANWGIPE